MRPGDQRAPPPASVFLPEARRGQGPPESERSHDRLHAGRWTGVFALRWTTVDALHIGSGAPTLRELRDGVEVARAMVLMQVGEDRVPVIPGSSLKGSTRSLAEALLGGCKLEGQCQPLCATCSLFGYAYRREHFASRVSFADALPQAEVAEGLVRLPQAYAPRKAGGRKVYAPPRAQLPGRVPYEVIAKDQSFLGELQVQNLSDQELGLVLVCLGLGQKEDRRFSLRVGGGKFAGLGRLRCAVTRLILRSGYRAPRGERLEGAAAAQRAQALADGYLPSQEAARVLSTIVDALGGAR